MTSPTCFLSYSWDTPDHQRWVRDLATSLQRNGVTVHLDQWDLRPGADLQQYMESCVRVSDFVLLICTPTYSMKANLGIGGVAYEKMLVTGELFGTISTHKFVPLLRKGSPNEAVPSFLKTRVFVDFRQAEAFDAASETLLRHLFSTPVHQPPNLGPPPAFAARSSSSASEATTPTMLLLCGGRYKFSLPSWWNDVKAKLPSEIVSSEEAFRHIMGRCDADIGPKRPGAWLRNSGPNIMSVRAECRYIWLTVSGREVDSPAPRICMLNSSRSPRLMERMNLTLHTAPLRLEEPMQLSVKKTVQSCGSGRP